MGEDYVLLVDDDVALSKLVTTRLKASSFKVDVVHDGASAMKKLEEIPDLVLLDRTLPDIEGLDICRKIREDKRLKNIPVIILSARDTSADKIEGLYMGADDYITKPFDFDELMARIDTVLRRRRFASELDKEREDLFDELKKLIDKKMIRPFFQPIFSLESSAPLGFEVLCRPMTQTILANPEVLFRTAIKFGLYSQLEMLCWQMAIDKWNKDKQKHKLFFNCTPYLIESEQFNGEILNDMGIDPSLVVIEITERIAVQNYSLFVEKLNVLKELGIKISVDDVGSGYASLDTVAEIKPEYVKIDMALVRNVHVDHLKASIVEAIISFSKKCEMKTIVEGIEQPEELKRVVELGADAGQGYLLARPTDGFIERSAFKI